MKAIKVVSVAGFQPGQTIAIDATDNLETGVIASVGTTGPRGSGITLTAALRQSHATGAQVSGNASTPGAPNRYDRGRK